MTQGSSQGSTRVYGMVTTISLVLTALVCGVVAFVIATSQVGASAEPTAIAGFPTSTSTLNGPTQPSTFTPAPFPTATDTQPASRMPSPSETPTPTDTATATNTMTPSNTPPATNTPLPTKTPTRGPYDYVLQDGVAVYKKNGKFSGCDAVIAGIVKDLNGSQSTQTNMKVHVTGNEANNIVNAGEHTEYGVSGWEYYFNNHTVERTYGVQLQYGDGTIASDVWKITTSANCNKNLALVTFIQVQARQ